LETGDTKELNNYQLVREFAASTWPLAADDKTVMRIACTAVDCGYHTDTVIDFARQCTESRVIAVRGDDRVKTAVYHAFKLPDKKTVRYDLNVTILKDRLYRLLFEAQVSGPGYMHLPADISEEILRQLASEEKRLERTRRGKRWMWVLKSSGTAEYAGIANHTWDLAVYAAFAAELVGARLLTSAEAQLDKQIKVIGRPVKKRPIRTRY